MTRKEMIKRHVRMTRRVERLRTQVANSIYTNQDKEINLRAAEELLVRFRIFMQTGQYPMIEEVTE